MRKGEMGTHESDDTHDAADEPGARADRLLDFLLDPAHYPHRPDRVELVETHISWVFLAGELVYKRKKPVRFDFLDFSTLAARRHACEEEVRLNRRLAPGVYLGVVPVTETDAGALALEGRGTPVEWLVKMRRLNTQRSLERLIERRELKRQQIVALAELLRGFYAQAERVPIEPDEYVSRFEEHVGANRQVLLEVGDWLPAEVVQRVHGAQLQLLFFEADRLRGRVQQGHIVDGHGDLRPEHICFDPEPIVFDCIEFSAEFRTVDVLDELCFLAMECDRRGAGWVGEALFEAHIEGPIDDEPLRLIAFYKCYRACVRAKVAALRATQHEGDARREAENEALEYLRLADEYREYFDRRFVIVVRGLMGTGKSTLAEALANQIGAQWLQTDRIRRELFGTPEAPANEAYAAGRYRPENRQRVYEEMFDRAARALENGLSVVLDGTFLSARVRNEAAALARGHGAELLAIRCQCDDEVARQRIERRRQTATALSEARPELLDRQRAEEEPDPPGFVSLEIDTTQPLKEQLERIRHHFGRRQHATSRG